MNRCAWQARPSKLPRSDISCRWPAVVLVDGRFACPYHVTNMVRDSLLRRARSLSSELTVQVEIDPDGTWFNQYKEALDRAENA